MAPPMDGNTTHILLGLIATLIGAMIAVHKATMTRADKLLDQARAQAEKASAQTEESIAELRRAVDAFVGFRSDSSAIASKIAADLKAFDQTHARILDTQVQLLSNQKRILEILERMEAKA